MGGQEVQGLIRPQCFREFLVELFTNIFAFQSAQVSQLEKQQARLEEQKRLKTSEMVKMKREIATIRREIADVNDESSMSTKLDDVKREIERKETEIRDISSNFDRDESK